MNFLWMNYCTGLSLVIGIIVKMLVLSIQYIIPLVLIIFGVYKYKNSKKKDKKSLIYKVIIAIILFALGMVINYALHASLDNTDKNNEGNKWHECYCELP